MRRFLGKDWESEPSLVYMVARYYDPRFGRFTSPDPEHTVMSPYAYVLNNPVNLVDPTGHTVQCGGAYQPNFNTRMWRMVMYGSYVWNQYPLPQEVNPIEPKEYIWGNWSGGKFVGASGRDPFEPMWCDPDAVERLISLYYRLVAKFNLNPVGVPGMLLSKDDILFNARSLTPEQQDIFLRSLLVSCLLSPEIIGKIATSAEGETKTINLTELYFTVLSNTPTQINVTRGMFAGETEAAKMVTEEGMYLLAFSSTREWDLNPPFPSYPSAATNLEAVMISFLHEMMHFATSAYDMEYGGGPSPNEHVPAFRWWSRHWWW